MNTLSLAQQDLTNDIYWRSKPPIVRALRDIQNYPLRLSTAMDLANKGWQIDMNIMVWGWDPVQTMRSRLVGGYTWVPAANQPGIPVAPGLSVPGMPSYDPENPPAGSIKVSLDAADYPPFNDGPKDPHANDHVSLNNVEGFGGTEYFASTALGESDPIGANVRERGWYWRKMPASTDWDLPKVDYWYPTAKG